MPAPDDVPHSPAADADGVEADTAPADRHERVIRAALLFQLGQEQADALDDALAIYDERPSSTTGAAPPDTPGSTDEQLLAAAALLADADVADAFYNDIAGLDVERATQAEAFGLELRGAAPRLDTTRARAAARAVGSWLVAQAHHAQSRSAEVEPFLEEALDAVPTFRPALELAAHYASDRGDAPKAMSLARRAGVPDNDPWVQMLSSMVPRARPDLGRNDPCHCGSGRKYKQCHLNDATTTLEQRADWLWHKAIDHLQDSRWQHQLVAVGDAMLGLDTTTYESMGFAMTDAVVADLVLFNDGGWADFLAVRGPLLPDDERELAEQWATNTRTLYEVESFEPGHTVTVRAAGDSTGTADAATIVVGELTYSRNAEVGDLIYAHVTHVGDTAQFFGGLVPIFTPSQRDELTALLATDPGGVAVAQLIHEWDAGDLPAVTNSEGEPLVFITTSFRVDATDAITAALDHRSELARADSTDDLDDLTGATDSDGDAQPLAGVPTAFGDGSPGDDDTVLGQWTEHVRVRDTDWIRGTIVLHDDRLVLRTNSEVRHARLRALIDTIIPGADVLDEHRQTIDPPA